MLTEQGKTPQEILASWKHYTMCEYSSSPSLGMYRSLFSPPLTDTTGGDLSRTARFLDFWLTYIAPLCRALPDVRFRLEMGRNGRGSLGYKH